MDKLSVYKLLSPSKEFQGSTVFHLFGRSKSSPAEVACAVDPFAYVSHLSAMEFHGIADRFPKRCSFAALPQPSGEPLHQKKCGRTSSRHDDYLAAGLPVLRFLPFSSVEGVRVHLLRRSKRGAFKIIKSPPTGGDAGEDLSDMLREPDNCGIQHVIDTYREYAARYLSLIVEEVPPWPVHRQGACWIPARRSLQAGASHAGRLAEGCAKGGSRMLAPRANTRPASRKNGCCP